MPLLIDIYFFLAPHSTAIFGIGAVCYTIEEETNAEAHGSNAEDAFGQAVGIWWRTLVIVGALGIKLEDLICEPTHRRLSKCTKGAFDRTVQSVDIGEAFRDQKESAQRVEWTRRPTSEIWQVDHDQEIDGR